MRRFWLLSRWGAALVIGVTLALLLFAVPDQSAKATTFKTTYSVAPSSTAASTPASVTQSFAIAAPDANFADLIYFWPNAWDIHTCIPAAFCPGAGAPGPPIFNVAASITSAATIGVLNSPCVVPVPLVGVPMFMSSTNNAGPVVPFGSGFAAVPFYPSYLNTLYPPATVGVPRARYYITFTVAGQPIEINVVIFEPGAIKQFPNQPSFPASQGFPMVSVLNDPTLDNTIGAISDFCTPLSTSITVLGAGFPSGAINLVNPGSGMYNFQLWSQSLYDADNDGFENDFDSCAFDDNLDGDPRIPGPAQDPDADGIDTACDDLPAVTGATPTYAPLGPGPTFDVDNDGYANRDDNCPLVFNREHNLAAAPPVSAAPFVQPDVDDDGLGDPIAANLPFNPASPGCDPDPSRPTGHNHERHRQAFVTIP